MIQKPMHKLTLTFEVGIAHTDTCVLLTMRIKTGTINTLIIMHSVWNCVDSGR